MSKKELQNMADKMAANPPTNINQSKINAMLQERGLNMRKALRMAKKKGINIPESTQQTPEQPDMTEFIATFNEIPILSPDVYQELSNKTDLTEEQKLAVKKTYIQGFFPTTVNYDVYKLWNSYETWFINTMFEVYCRENPNCLSSDIRCIRARAMIDVFSALGWKNTYSVEAKKGILIDSKLNEYRPAFEKLAQAFDFQLNTWSGNSCMHMLGHCIQQWNGSTVENSKHNVNHRNQLNVYKLIPGSHLEIVGYLNWKNVETLISK